MRVITAMLLAGESGKYYANIGRYDDQGLADRGVLMYRQSAYVILWANKIQRSSTYGRQV